MMNVPFLLFLGRHVADLAPAGVLEDTAAGEAAVFL